ncbi:MAG TPA: pilus assembly protein TadG-related protein [Gemmataceae bacterium]|nr:pilus assembly protein TadG-related protein [Gemmataceae bacterium]
MRSQLSSHGLSLRRGGVTPLTVLSLALLLGVVAVAVDGGSLMEQRRHVQATADAAALAAAADLFANYVANQGADPSGTAASSALASAAANGFSNDGVQSIVTVSVSPQKYQSGPSVGQPLPAGYVEVIVQSNAGRTFSNIFGSGAIPVRARAVARGQWISINDDVIALNLRTSSAVSITGSGGLNLQGSLRINSSSSSALSLSGGGGVTASQYNLNSAGGGIAGWLVSILNGLGGSPPSISYGPPVADPLRYLADPDPVALGLPLRGTYTRVNAGTVKDLYPGVYNGGITVSSAGTAILHANSDGTPGIYYLQGGGFTVGGPSNVKMATGETAGIMLYNSWSRSVDAINLSGSGTLNITPPSTGIYKGISIFQKRGTASTAGPIVNVSGQSSANVTGTIYAAHAMVSLSTTGAANVLGGQVIADTLSLTGSAAVNINRGTQPVANTRTLGLVE